MIWVGIIIIILVLIVWVIKDSIDINKEEKEELEKRNIVYEKNSTATIIKAVSIVATLIGVIAGGIMSIDEIMYGTSIIIASIIGGIFIYARGEEIELLSCVKTNTEHLRDEKKMQNIEEIERDV